MKLITRHTDYALRVLLYMAQQKKQAAAPELLEALRIPRAFLRQILQRLSRHKLLTSSKGRNGGFELARSPSAIRVTDVMRIFQGALTLNECMFKKQLCADIKVCPLRKRISSLEDQLIANLTNITLETLLNDARTSRHTK